MENLHCNALRIQHQFCVDNFCGLCCNSYEIKNNILSLYLAILRCVFLEVFLGSLINPIYVASNLTGPVCPRKSKYVLTKWVFDLHKTSNLLAKLIGREDKDMEFPATAQPFHTFPFKTFSHKLCPVQNFQDFLLQSVSRPKYKIKAKLFLQSRLCPAWFLAQQNLQILIWTSKRVFEGMCP